MTCTVALGLSLYAGVMEVKEEATEDEVPVKMDGEDQEASGEDKEKGVKTAEGVKKEGIKHRSREVSHERRERHRSAGSSHYSHHSHSPHSQRRGSRHHMSPSRKPGVLTFAQIRVSARTLYNVETLQPS